MNLDFNRTQPVLVYWLNSQLVVTTAIILTCSPGKKEQRPYASLYAVVRRTNPVACALWFRGSMRKFVGGSLTPGEGETVPVTLINRAFGWLKTGPRSNCQSNTLHYFQTGSEPMPAALPAPVYPTKGKGGIRLVLQAKKQISTGRGDGHAVRTVGGDDGISAGRPTAASKARSAPMPTKNSANSSSGM